MCIAGAETSDGRIAAFVNARRMEAAQAFRVLRDTRTSINVSETEYYCRAPCGDIILRLSHPGHWSPTLGAEAALLRVEPPLAGATPAAWCVELFRRSGSIATALRVTTPHLAAWSLAGRDFEWGYPPLERQLGAGWLPLVHAQEDFAGVLAWPGQAAPVGVLCAGSLFLWGACDVPELTQRVIAFEEAARIRNMAEAAGYLRQQGDAPSRPDELQYPT